MSSFPSFLGQLFTKLTSKLRVQKRALACIFPGKPYAEALSIVGLVSIREHHSAIKKKLFQLIAGNLLPSENCHTPVTNYNLRRPIEEIYAPPSKNKEVRRSFIIQYRNNALYT